MKCAVRQTASGLVCGRAMRWLAAIILCAGAAAAPAFAQTGRVAGKVMDVNGEPIKGATVTAENAKASPPSFTATTDDKGRWSMIGMAHGFWQFTAVAPGYQAESGRMEVKTLGVNSPIEFRLKKGGGPMAAGGANAKELQAELGAADQMMNAGNYDAAIAAYQAILQKMPTLTLLNMQIGRAYEQKKEYDKAVETYKKVLDTDPKDSRAMIAVGMAQMAKGDLAGAEASLQDAVAKAPADREVYYNLAEVKFAGGKTDEAAQYYQKASEADPNWGKPIFKLGLVALNKGDKAKAAEYLEKTIAVDPNSPEAAAAKQALEQYGLKK